MRPLSSHHLRLIQPPRLEFEQAPNAVHIDPLAGSLSFFGVLGPDRKSQRVIGVSADVHQQLDAVRRRNRDIQIAVAIKIFNIDAHDRRTDIDRQRVLRLKLSARPAAPVTELVTGIDIVEQMIRVAAGEELGFKQGDVKLNGWAIESRLYAEDPYRNFLPSIGRLSLYRPPAEGKGPDGIIVRNDTGVYEGGEISMFYDPMIAKLCTWAPDRARAIAAMSDALDAFEVEGIGHNLPFLSAVMAHPRFSKGDLTTAFIADEWPDGFSGVALPQKTCQALASIASACNFVAHQRAARISGVMENHRHHVGQDWVASVDSHDFPLAIVRDGENFQITHVGYKPIAVDIGGWRPGQTLIRARTGRQSYTVKIEARPNGYRLRYRGADIRAFVRGPREAELARLMLVKQPADTSRLLLCPMPGMIVSIEVVEGEEVQEGQTLATVEAMKMENILRAERKKKIRKINVKPGDSLAVDQVIMEFE